MTTTYDAYCPRPRRNGRPDPDREDWWRPIAAWPSVPTFADDRAEAARPHSPRTLPRPSATPTAPRAAALAAFLDDPSAGVW